MQKNVQVPGEDRRSNDRRSGEERRRIAESRLQRRRDRAIKESDRRAGAERRGTDGSGLFSQLRGRLRRWWPSGPPQRSDER